MKLKTIYFSLSFSLFIFLALCYLVSCTCSVTMVHTEGRAMDIVDETSTNTPTTSIKPTFSLPAAAIL